MASSKTKRMMAVTALSASLLLGGVAAAQAHDNEHAACAAKGKGEGTGAPGNDKGRGEGTGAPGKDNGKGHGTGAPSADRRHGCEDKDKPKDRDEEMPAAGSETPGTGSETPGTDTEVPGSGSESPGTDTTVNVDVDIKVDGDLPDPTGLAEDIAQDVLGMLTPAAVNAVGHTTEIATEVTDRATNDVSAIAGLLDEVLAQAASFDAGSFDVGAGVTAGQSDATANLSLGGTTSAVTSLVAGMLLAV